MSAVMSVKNARGEKEGQCIARKPYDRFMIPMVNCLHTISLCCLEGKTKGTEFSVASKLMHRGDQKQEPPGQQFVVR